VIVLLDRPDPHGFTPVGAHTRLVCSPAIAQISVAEVYRAANELLAASRTDQLFYSEQR
jgi:hypothetical protein